MMKADNIKSRARFPSSFIPEASGSKDPHPSSFSPHRSGFTLIELLVVIGIIVILVAILLPAVAKVRTAARTAETTSELKDLAAAIEAYSNDFSAYPGPFSNAQVCNATPSGIVGGSFANAGQNFINVPTPAPPGFDSTSISFAHITMSENLVLGLMGGLRTDTSNNLIYDPTQVGNGAISLATANPTRGRAYIDSTKNLSWRTTDSNDTPVAAGLKTGHFRDDLGAAKDTIIPEFQDTFPDPLPILYLRARKGASTNPPYTNLNNTIITYDPDPSEATLPQRAGQYDLHQIIGYTGAPIGAGRKPAGPNVGWTGAVTHGLSTTATDNVDVLSTLKSPGAGSVKYYYPYNAYAYFRNASLSTPVDITVDSSGNATANPDFTDTTKARNDVPFQKDGFILISAGPDRIYGTKDDITNFGGVGQ